MTRLPLRAAALAAALCAALPANARACEAAGVQGPQARWWHAGTWRPLAEGDALPQAGVILSTGPGSRVDLACPGGLAVTIGADTEVNLGPLLTRPERGPFLQLLHGAVGLAAQARDWLGLEVRTPLAIASVRSTEWLALHDPAGGSAVFVRAGAVRFRPLGPGAPLALGPGEGVDIAPGAPPGAVATWGAGRVEAVGARLGFGWR